MSYSQRKVCEEKMKVLLVEDDFVVRQGIKNSIEWNEHGLEICEEAMNGEVGFGMVEDHRPEIVITDIKMPIMDGLIFTQKVKEKYPEIEVIILSGFDDFEYAKKAIHYGVHDYLLKPINADELVRCICRLRNEIIERKQVQKNHEEVIRILKNSRIEIKKEESIVVEGMQKYDVFKIYDGINLIFKKALQEEKEIQKVRHTCIRLIVIIVSNMEELLIPVADNFPPLDEMIWDMQQYHTFESMQKYMEQFVGRVARQLHQIEKEKYSVIIHEASRYVEDHYQEEITVKIISAQLFITPNYFSQVFKAKKGMNFTEYLNDFRIEKSKKLLRNIELRVYEVAELVGYQNYKYFSKIFRMHTGFSPKEYRNIKRI